MSILATYLMPHPPIILPEVGKGEELVINKTIESLHQVGKEISQKSPTTIVLITPHGTMFSDSIHIVGETTLSGDLSTFGVPEVTMKQKINLNLSKKLESISTQNNIPVVLSTQALLDEFNVTLQLDHGALVPLHFINTYYEDYTLVHITYAPFSDLDLYNFGRMITEAAENLTEDIVVIASGDLSHRLKDQGPYDYSPYGTTFDHDFLTLLKEGQVTNIFEMDSNLINEAGECGRRSVLIMLGALDTYNFKGELLSYEGPFGVGYGVMKFEPTNLSLSKLHSIEATINEKTKKKLENQDPYVKLARESLTTFIQTKKVLDVPEYITDEMKSTKRGVFVSLKKHGDLRGCIGTIFPTTDSIADEIIRNAIEAGFHDPRFYEVEEDELLDIDFSVDVLTEPETTTIDQLNPKDYGVIVSTPTKKGLLLPDLDGINSIEEQLSIAIKKAGIEPNEAYRIERFQVIRHSEI
jgi:hypothetical protein